MSNLTHQPTGQSSTKMPQSTRIFRAVLSRLIGDVVFGVVLFVLAFQTQARQLFIVAGSLVGTVIVVFIGMGLIRRNRVEQGSWLIILSLFPVFLVNSILIAGLGLMTSLIIVLLTTTTAVQILPRRVSWAVIASIGWGIVIVLLDLFLPTANRLIAPLVFQTFTPIAVGALILILAFFSRHEFANYSLRTKLIISFVATGILSIGIIAFATNYLTRQALTEKANQSLLAAASHTADNLDTFVKTNLDIVRTETQLPDFVDYLSLSPDQRKGSETEREVASILRNLSRRDPIFISSYALLDRQGTDLVDTYSPDIGLNKSDQDYFQTPLQTGLPYASPVRLSDTVDELAIYFSSPVRNRAGEILGVLRFRYNAAILQQLITRNNGLAGSESFAMLLDENHIRLAHGTAPDLVLKSVAPLDPARVAELQAAGRLPDRPLEELSTDLPSFEQGLANAVAQPYFSGELGEVENKTNEAEAADFDVEQAAIVAMETQPWLVVFAQTQAVTLAPVQTQTQTTILLAVFIALAVAGIAFGLGQYLASPIVRLTQVAQRVAEGDLQAQAAIESKDEIGQLATAFNHTTAQLRSFIGSLEEQVQARTAELALSMEVGQRAAAIRDLTVLLPTITEFIKDRFNLYYTQVYFVDDIGQNLILRAGTGEVGQELVARRHSLPIGLGSIVGRVAAEGRSIVVPDTEISTIHKPNPLLPETRSELAAPLIIEGQVVGVLDMQSNSANTFTKNNLTVFEALATQLAISIDSAQQWLASQEAQHRAEEALRQFTRESWTEALSVRRKTPGYVYDLSAIMSLSDLEVEAQNGETVITDSKSEIKNGLSVPLVVQNQPIGQLSVQAPPKKKLSADEQALLSAVAQQLAQKAENLRLFEETQQRATREQIARQITDKIRASRDIETALKTAAAELSKALNTSKAVIELKVSQDDDEITR